MEPILGGSASLWDARLAVPDKAILGCTEHSLHFLVPVLQIWQREGARDFKSHGNAEFDRSGSQMPPGLTESRCPHISRYDFNHIFFDSAIVKLCLYDKLNLNFLHHCHLYGFVKRMND